MVTFALLLAAGMAAPAASPQPPASSTTAAGRPAPHVEHVQFESAGDTLAGLLFRPAGAPAPGPIRAVVVTGAWTTIKEHMPALYARELADRGYIALAFDFRGWGESGGQPRSLESPALKIADIEAAVRYLHSLPDVPPGSVAGLGVCASAGYMAHAATRSPIARIALVAPWLHDREIVEQVYGGPDGVAALVARGRAAEQRYLDTGEASLIPAAGPTGSEALMAGAPYYTEPDRGAIPRWENTFNLASWEGWLRFDGIAAADAIRQPVLVVHSEAAAIPQGARRFLDRLDSPKRAVWLDGVSQFDFYDQPVPVAAAADAVAAFYRAEIASAGDGLAVHPHQEPRR